MTVRTSPVRDVATPPRLGDVVITLLLLAVFVAAYLGAREWPFQAALFPQLLSGAGIVLALLKLGGFGVEYARCRRSVAGTEGTGQPGPAGAPRDDGAATGARRHDDEQEDQSLEYVFGTAGRRAWAEAVGWGLGFFVLLWFVGVFVAVPLFALAYLRIAGRTSWLGAGSYAAVAGVLLWLVFHTLLMVPMPAGIF